MQRQALSRDAIAVAPADAMSRCQIHNVGHALRSKLKSVVLVQNQISAEKGFYAGRWSRHGKIIKPERSVHVS
jgi:hypothetical protein